MTINTDTHAACTQSPSLQNQTQRDWDAHAQLAYCFARHARHDLANVHCALGMLEMVEQIQADHPEMPLPEELNIENIRIKAREDVKKVISISNDLILLNQAASMYAYKASQTMSLSELIQQQIIERLDSNEQHPEQLLVNSNNTRVVAMGDMLGVALSACYCQWTPWSQEHHNASHATLTKSNHQVILHFPADNVEIIGQFARQLASSQPDEPLSIPLEQHLTTTTGTMALWLARHIIIIHGGHIAINADQPQDGLFITLPTMA